MTQELCDVLRVGGTRTAACAHVGIHISTFYGWLDRHRDFSGAIARAESEAELRMGAVVMHAAIRDNDWKAAAFWLERRRPDEWAERQKIEAAIAFDVPALMRENLVAREALPPASELGSLLPPGEVIEGQVIAEKPTFSDP